MIPGGTCEFDLPAYHAWQQEPPARRRADLNQWAGSLAPMAQAVSLLLQLLRLRIDPALQLIPEISGNRLMVSVRLVRHGADGKLHPAREEAPFELALCA